MGIDLKYAEYNFLYNNNCTNNYWAGIRTRFANHNIFKKNLCSFNAGSGIFSEYSDNNKLRNNICFKNGVRNIYFFASNNNDLLFNNCNGSKTGIYISSSENNIITNNSCLNNSLDGIYLTSSANNIISDNECNFNYDNGIKLYYSHNNLLIKNSCNFNNYSGLYFFKSHYLILNKNTLSENFHGIYNSGSDHCSLNDDKCFDNSYGIYFVNSENNVLKKCICNDNENGIYLLSSVSNKIENNTCNSNNITGIRIDSSGTNIISNNTCLNNLDGISIAWNCQKNNITSNYCSMNFNIGISIDDVETSTFSNNTCLNNDQGIVLMNSRYNSLISNNCSNNGDGIIISGCYSNIIINTLIFSNTNNGIYFHDSNRYNNVYGNTISDTSGNGIKLETNSNNNAFYHNNLLNNSVQAVELGTNQWDNGDGEGNYWSDYSGIDNGANNRTAGDGIGDTKIPHLDLDNYPFMRQNGWLKLPPPILIDPGEVDTDGTYVLSWICRHDVDFVVLQEDDNSRFSSPTEIYKGESFQYKVTGRDEGTYYYRVRSFKDKYYSPWSNKVNITVDIGPDTPRNLEVASWPEGNVLNISWIPNDDFETIGYELQVKTVAHWVSVINLTHPLNNYDHKGLTDGIQYSYRLRAWDNLNRSSRFTAPVVGVPKDIVPPKLPTGLKIVNKTFNSITLDWDPQYDLEVVGFNIYRTLVSQPFDWGVPVNGKNPKRGNGFRDTGLEEGTTYYYVVTAVDEIPNESQYSAEVSATTFLISEYPQPPAIDTPPKDFTILEDTYDNSSINLLQWFSDINNDPLTFRCQDKKHLAVAMDFVTGSVLIKPDKDWSGVERLTFIASDGKFETSDTITITVLPVNDPPGPVKIITPKDGIKVEWGDLLDFEASCKDPDIIYGDRLTYTWRSNIDGLLGSGYLLTDVNLSAGEHTINLTVIDQENEEISATINVIVKEPGMDEESEPNVSEGLGLLIGVIIVVIIIIILIGLLYIRYRKRKIESQAPEKSAIKLDLKKTIPKGIWKRSDTTETQSDSELSDDELEELYLVEEE